MSKAVKTPRPTINRFTSSDDLNKALTPIASYENYPLVSLKEALKPVSVSCKINGLQRSVDEAYQHCHYPSPDGLTRDESAAIYLYSMETGEDSLYQHLNRILRDANRQKIVPWFYLLKLLDSALAKVPIVKGSIWRGVPLDVSEQYQRDELVTWSSFSSCSSLVEVVEGFLKPNQNSTLFMIEAVDGRDISAYCMYRNEEEVLLKMGTQLRVKSNGLKRNDLRLIHLVEIVEFYCC